MAGNYSNGAAVTERETVPARETTRERHIHSRVQKSEEFSRPAFASPMFLHLKSRMRPLLSRARYSALFMAFDVVMFALPRKIVSSILMTREHPSDCSQRFTLHSSFHDRYLSLFPSLLFSLHLTRIR